MEKYGVDSSEIQATDSTKEAIEKIAAEEGIRVPNFNNEKEAEEFLNKLLER